MRNFRWLLSGLGLLTFAYHPALAADMNQVPNLRQMAQHSAYIFTGTVSGIHKNAPAQNGSVGTVDITFRVDQAVRGTRARQMLTIREWSGLWDAAERYRRGQRVLLFLYPPSRLGLTSPVGGPAGRWPLDAQGSLSLQRAQELLGPALDPACSKQARIPARDLARAIRRMVPE